MVWLQKWEINFSWMKVKVVRERRERERERERAVYAGGERWIGRSDQTSLIYKHRSISSLARNPNKEIGKKVLPDVSNGIWWHRYGISVWHRYTAPAFSMPTRACSDSSSGEPTITLEWKKSNFFAKVFKVQFSKITDEIGPLKTQPIYRLAPRASLWDWIVVPMMWRLTSRPGCHLGNLEVVMVAYYKLEWAFSPLGLWVVTA